MSGIKENELYFKKQIEAEKPAIKLNPKVPAPAPCDCPLHKRLEEEDTTYQDAIRYFASKNWF